MSRKNTPPSYGDPARRRLCVNSTRTYFAVQLTAPTLKIAAAIFQKKKQLVEQVKLPSSAVKFPRAFNCPLRIGEAERRELLPWGPMIVESQW